MNIPVNTLIYTPLSLCLFIAPTWQNPTLNPTLCFPWVCTQAATSPLSPQETYVHSALGSSTLPAPLRPPWSGPSPAHHWQFRPSQLFSLESRLSLPLSKQLLSPCTWQRKSSGKVIPSFPGDTHQTPLHPPPPYPLPFCQNTNVRAVPPSTECQFPRLWLPQDPHPTTLSGLCVSISLKESLLGGSQTRPGSPTGKNSQQALAGSDPQSPALLLHKQTNRTAV